MSYATMDHAGWVQNNIGYARSGKKRRDDLAKGWDAVPDVLNTFQRNVFDILGMTFGGIYNAPIAWDAVQWKGWAQGIFIPIGRGRSVSTFDYADLTRLVFLCHESRIRCEIRPHGFAYLGLAFFQREATGSMGQRHPNLDEAVADFRAYLPADHPIIYRAPETAEAAQ
jgi:hypothetical protein